MTSMTNPTTMPWIALPTACAAPVLAPTAAAIRVRAQGEVSLGNGHAMGRRGADLGFATRVEGIQAWSPPTD